MGLDITAYEKLERIHAPTNYWCEEHEEEVQLYNLSEFHEQAAPSLEGDHADDYVRYGCFKSVELKFGFRAGSYTGYNEWRERLCRVALNMSTRQLWDHPKEGPFVELLHFPDNEGVIETSVCAKLSKDFVDHRERISKLAEDTWFMEKYDCWARAFKLASVSGAVELH